MNIRIENKIYYCLYKSVLFSNCITATTKLFYKKTHRVCKTEVSSHLSTNKNLKAQIILLIER